MTGDLGKTVRFQGNQAQRDKTIRFVDSVLKRKGNFEGFADLSGGVDSVADRFCFHIIDDDDSFAIKVEPVSGNGQVFQFVIDKESETVYRPVDDNQQIQGDENTDFLEDI